MSALTILVSACSPDDPQGTNLQVVPNLKNSPRGQPIKATHQQIVQASEVECAEGAPCLNAIAQLIATPASATGLVSAWDVCTSYKIDDETMMTNTHCVPSDLRVAGANCRGRISFVFPAMGNLPSEKVSCDKIIFARPIFHKSQNSGVNLRHSSIREVRDIAVLQVKGISPQRNSLAFSRAGIDGNMWVHAIDYHGQGHSVYDVRRCTASQAILKARSIFPVLDTAASSPIVLNDCGVQKGNSGGPVVGLHNDIRAIVFGTNTYQDGTSVGLAVNLACLVGLEHLMGLVPSGCQRDQW